MADIYPEGDGVVLRLNWKEGAYVLACLGASNSTLFDRTTWDAVDGMDAHRLFTELREALDVPVDPLARGGRVARLFRDYSEVLDAWHGARHYERAKRVAEEVGL